MESNQSRSSALKSIMEVEKNSRNHMVLFVLEIEIKDNEKGSFLIMR